MFLKITLIFCFFLFIFSSFTEISAQTVKKDLLEVYSELLIDMPGGVSKPEVALVEKEVRKNEKQIKMLVLGKEAKCATEDFVVINVGEGSFTRPKSVQKAYLYELCAAHPFYVSPIIGGVLIVENSTVETHLVFGEEPPYFMNMKVLPDINRNGLSELSFQSSIYPPQPPEGLLGKEIDIFEFTNELARSIGWTTVTPNIEGVRDYQVRILVKPGKIPIFYREVYNDFVTENSGWKLKKKPHKIYLKRRIDTSKYFKKL